MFGRRCRTMVPTPTALLQSRVTQADNQQVKSQKRKQVRSYNRYKARARPFDTGPSVTMKPFNTGGKQWRRGRILQRLDERSYLVQASSGPVRRTREHLRQVPDKTPEVSLLPATPPVREEARAIPTAEDITDVIQAPKATTSPEQHTTPVPRTSGRVRKRPACYDEHETSYSSK